MKEWRLHQFCFLLHQNFQVSSLQTVSRYSEVEYKTDILILLNEELKWGFQDMRQNLKGLHHKASTFNVIKLCTLPLH